MKIATREPNYNPYRTMNNCFHCGWVPKNVPEDYRCSVCNRSVRTGPRNRKRTKKDTRIRHEGGD